MTQAYAYWQNSLGTSYPYRMLRWYFGRNGGRELTVSELACCTTDEIMEFAEHAIDEWDRATYGRK